MCSRDWQEKYLLVVDEVGMLGARMLYAVDEQLCTDARMTIFKLVQTFFRLHSSKLFWANRKRCASRDAKKNAAKPTPSRQKFVGPHPHRCKNTYVGGSKRRNFIGPTRTGHRLLRQRTCLRTNRKSPQLFQPLLRRAHVFRYSAAYNVPLSRPQQQHDAVKRRTPRQLAARMGCRVTGWASFPRQPPSSLCPAQL